MPTNDNPQPTAHPPPTPKAPPASTTGTDGAGGGSTADPAVTALSTRQDLGFMKNKACRYLFGEDAWERLTADQKREVERRMCVLWFVFKGEYAGLYPASLDQWNEA